jgi:hypothetical protein
LKESKYYWLFIRAKLYLSKTYTKKKLLKKNLDAIYFIISLSIENTKNRDKVTIFYLHTALVGITISGCGLMVDPGTHFEVLTHGQ